jgi:hypothetical protein
VRVEGKIQQKECEKRTKGSRGTKEDGNQGEEVRENIWEASGYMASGYVASGYTASGYAEQAGGGMKWEEE